MARVAGEINLWIARLHRADITFKYTHSAMLEGQEIFRQNEITPPKESWQLPVGSCQFS